ncbi:MAG: hydantoinase B/oxoprolinase family protein [Chloroflexi bacterium]|nr:hydantoinase B/oxoprolinase family protein [Chloroflexota bacterium]
MIDNIDPITFEIVRHKLWQIIDEMGITLKRVSGSPSTTEANDFMVGLFTANGEILISGVGVTWHIVCASTACKHILKFFGKEGIKQGDIFLLNDPYVAAFHQSDVYIVTPIYHEGKRVAWTANFTHVNDIGGVDAGGMCPRATEVFHEGLRIPGLKIAEAGIFRSDVMQSLLNMTRDPGMVALDLRSQIAANNVANARLQEIFDKYGEETIISIMETIIGHSEAFLRARLRRLPDGNWSTVQYLDTADRFHKIALSLTKRSDNLLFDFSGSSPQVEQGINCTYWGTMGSVFAAVAALICYKTTWNAGILKPIQLTAPEGTIVNCRHPAPVSMSTIMAGHLCVLAAGFVISKMLGASDTFRDDLMAVWRGGSISVKPSGKGAGGRNYIATIMHPTAGSGGARSFADGVDTGGLFAYLISSAPNIETLELNYPLLHLFRRQARDSGGPGKYRGGMSGEYGFKLHDTAGRKACITLSSMGNYAVQAHGICGGYPGAGGRVKLFRNTTVEALLMAGQAVDSATHFAGRPKDMPPQTTFEMTDRDVLFVRWAAGGGYGDPLDRDPGLVWNDIQTGAVSGPAAKRTYGVFANKRLGGIDAARTEKMRKGIKAMRMTEMRREGQKNENR